MAGVMRGAGGEKRGAGGAGDADRAPFLEKSIQGVVGKDFQIWVRGWLLALSKEIRSSVIFLYNEKGGGDVGSGGGATSGDDFAIIDDEIIHRASFFESDDEPKGRIPNIRSVCDTLRGHIRREAEGNPAAEGNPGAKGTQATEGHQAAEGDHSAASGQAAEGNHTRCADWYCDYCQVHDREAALAIDRHVRHASQGGGALPEGWGVFATEYPDVSVYRYLCPATTLVEWAVPISIQGEPVGVFVTGRFRGADFDVETAQRSILACAEAMGASSQIGGQQFTDALFSKHPVEPALSGSGEDSGGIERRQNRSGGVDNGVSSNVENGKSGSSDNGVRSGGDNGESGENGESDGAKGCACPDSGNAFFERIHAIQTNLGERYVEKVRSAFQELQETALLSITNWNQGFTDTIADASEGFFTSQFKMLRTSMYNLFVDDILEKPFGLTRLEVFKPRANVLQLDKKSPHIQAFTIRRDSQRVEDAEYDQNLTFSPFVLNLQSTALKRAIAESAKGLVTYTAYGSEIPRDLLKPCPPADIDPGTTFAVEDLDGDGGVIDPYAHIDRCVLIVLAMKNHERYSLGFLARFARPVIHGGNGSLGSNNIGGIGGNSGIGGNDPVVEGLVSLLTSVVGPLYLAQWNEIYAKYQRFNRENINRFIRHEIGDVLIGLRERNRQMNIADVDLRWLLEEKLKKTAFANSIETHARALEAYLTDVTRYTSTLEFFQSVLSGFDFKLRPEWFWPYKEIMFKLVNIFDSICANDPLSFKQLQMGVPPSQVNMQDKDRPKIYADADKLQQIAANLLRNAIKYSYPGTNIYVDFKLDETREYYCLTVTNYGYPIPAEERPYLFERGFRGARAVLIDKDAGVGMGLHIVKTFAELHKGFYALECDVLSELNIPLLPLYRDFETDYRENAYVDCPVGAGEISDLLAGLRKPKNERGRSVYDEVVIPGGIPNTALSREFLAKGGDAEGWAETAWLKSYFPDHLHDPTARIRFIVKFPHLSKEGGQHG